LVITVKIGIVSDMRLHIAVGSDEIA